MGLVQMTRSSNFVRYNVQFMAQLQQYFSTEKAGTSLNFIWHTFILRLFISLNPRELHLPSALMLSVTFQLQYFAVC